MRRILSPVIPILLMFVIVLVGCSGKDNQSTVKPAFTSPPEGEGSAILVYTLSSKKSGLNASSSIGIPIAITFDSDNAKEQARIQGSNVADYAVSITGNDQGKECTIEFTLLVEYDVVGNYNPNPQCDFDVIVRAEILSDQIQKSGTCSVPLQNSYPAAGLFIPPPEIMKKIPGSLPVVPLRDDDGTKITVELTNVVVPESSGCFFGG